jgi:nickel-dependent lactate racemase
MDWQTALLGADVQTVQPRKPQSKEDPKRIIENAVLEAGLLPFLEQAHLNKAALTILLNDPDRFTDSRTALEVILRIAEKRNLSLRCRVLFATGSHSFSTEQIERHERNVLPRYSKFPFEKAWHDCRDRETVGRLGDVQLHKWVVEAARILVIGSMEPHYFAGVTGAHKTMTVGVMAYDSLSANHFHAMSADAKGLATAGNPVHERIAAIVEALSSKGKKVFTINEVLVDQRIVACVAGDPLEALERGLPEVRRIYSYRLNEPADLIVARVGPPLDKNLYQADKGIKNVENAVRDGGVILLDAPCHEGTGIDRFLELMKRASSHAAAVALVQAEGYRLGDHKAVRLRALTENRGVSLGIIPKNLGEREARIAGLESFTDANTAISWARAAIGRDAISAVIVEDAGNMTVTI